MGKFRPVLLTQLGIFLAALFALCSNGHGAIVAYWNFDEGTGTNVFDTAGNTTRTNNGFYATPAEAPTRVPGRFGGALGFAWTTAPNAAGKRVVVPYHTNLTLNGPMTISYWYRMDAPTPSGFFPGIMRLGAGQQGTLGPANVGWGFFRTGNMTYKRGNNQPTLFGAMNVGQWYHLALTWNGNTNAGINNTTGYLNGVAVPLAAVNGWSNVTSLANFEMGLMDQFDTATLDDLALFGSEAIAPAKVRSIYTVPTALFLDYNLADMRTIWGVFDGAGTSNAVVKGTSWSYTPTLPGSTTAGDAYISGGSLYVVLGTGTGITAPLTVLGGTLSPAGIGTLGTLAANNPLLVTNANLIFDLTADTTAGLGSNDLLNVTGDLTMANSTVSIDPLAPLPGGTYRLVNYSGASAGSLTLSNTTRYSLALDTTTTNQINLTVSGTNGSVIWNSTSSSAWDLSSLNFSNLLTSTPDRFFQGDSVLFDDSGAFQTNITVSTPVFPRSITINSSTRPYVFTGGEQIGGAPEGITKNGTGTLVLSTPNTFTGDVLVNGGLLRIGNSSALGTTNGQTIIAIGATLDLVGINPGTESITVQGAGLGSTGAVVNTGAAIVNNGLRGRVTLLGDTTFGGVARWDIANSVVTGNGFNVTKFGTHEMYLNANGNMGFGDVTINAGFFTWGGNSTPGDPTRTYTVGGSGVLNFFSHTVPFNKVLVLQNGATVQNGSGTPNLAGPVTLNGTANFNLANPVLVSNVISGPGTLLKLGASALTLFGTNTYTGPTTISAGRLNLLANASIATSPRINVLTGTVLDVSRVVGAYPLSSNQTLAGVGIVAGSLAVPADSRVVPGSDSVFGTLTVTNALALSGGTLVFDIAAATTEGAGINDLINVGGNLDLTGVTKISVNPLGVLTIGNVYTLINYTGTLSGVEANLTITNDSRYTFTISLATPGKVLLTVNGGAAADLFWLGGALGAENLWDIKTSVNWSDNLGSPETFFGGDKVVFDDFATTNIVDLVGNLTPATIRIENGDPAFNYVFQGSGKLSGNSSLTKVFSSKVTIANTGVNDYVGATDIREGTLQVGTGGTFGNLGTGPVTNNSTLILNRSDTLTLANTLLGSGNIIKSNANILLLPTANPNYNGTITAIAGTVRPTAAANALGDAVGATVIGSGATLDVNAINLGGEPVIVSGSGVGGNGAIINGSGTGQNNALRVVTLAGDTVVGGAGRWDIRTNGPTPLNASLSTGGNPYNLTKVAANQVSVVDAVVDPALANINVNSGILSFEFGSGAGNPASTVTVANAATLQFFNLTVPWNKVAVFTGGATLLNNSGTTVMNGAGTLNGAVTFNIAGTSLSFLGPLGGSGSLTKSGASPLILGSDNTYPGATTVSAGTLQLGAGGAAGWVAGPITLGANPLTVFRSDTVVVSNALTGTGTLNLKTPAGLVLSNTVNFSLINVGLNTPGRLVLQPGFVGNIGSFSIGENTGSPYGEVYQFGGTVTVSATCRVGHWPGPQSTYLMGGGNLTLTGIPAGPVNLATASEQNGILYLGVDGHGVFYQTGGVARAHGIVLDARGVSPGVDTFALEGGQFIVGPSGFKTGSGDSNAPSAYSVQLGGGTITSSATWTSTVNMSFSGTNGNLTLDTASFTNTLNSPVAGPGGVVKVGTGTLRLNGTNTFAGTLTVSNGTLDGNGIISGPVVVNSGGTFSPGTSIGALRVNNTLNLSGNTLIEINKTGSVLTNDSVANVTTLTYGGSLTVVATGNALTNGDTFAVFGAAAYSGSFASTNLPPLATGLAWDLSRLTVDGTITVVEPRPRFSPPSLSGNILTLAGTGGTPNGTYRVMQSADIAAPLASWTQASTGNFDVNGNFSVGITINPVDPQLFYAIVAP